MSERRFNRNKFLKMLGVVAAAPLVSRLDLHTAYAETAVSANIYMFHKTGGGAVDGVLAANIANGRTPVTAASLAEMVLGERRIPDGGVFCLTFDDGYLIQYQQAVPVLRKWQAAGTFFCIGPDWILAGGDGVNTYMQPNHWQQLHKEGHEIASHTNTHRDLLYLWANNRDKVDEELRFSKNAIEGIIDDSVKTLAYPNGSFNLGIEEIAARYYIASVSTIPGILHTSSLLQELRRTRIN